MLKYLVILLDDTATSYCCYRSEKQERRLISLEDLRAGILFAMKQNLMLQVVYPACEIPAGHREAIETIDHCKVAPAGNGCEKRADVVAFDRWSDAEAFAAAMEGKKSGKIVALRLAKAEFFACYSGLVRMLRCVERLNVVITDVETFGEQDFTAYSEALAALGMEVKKLYAQGAKPQLNILTDRLALEAMNSCNAGYESVTLAPNGKFYVCPAFYLEDEGDAVGDLSTGLDVKNRQLYGLQHAPLCRACDAYQCKRCIWLNRKTTGEVNTPSREQCIVAHLERNASAKLLRDLQSTGEYTSVKEIGELSCLDPFLNYELGITD
ncbi:MAG: CXXX repeat peptide maturase [Prevotellaceae bacterium]|jgi:CXXX repeat peptide maturase|nr:CXXX repeat peptide maturase [Prevotellaceae bacterium]